MKLLTFIAAAALVLSTSVLAQQEPAADPSGSRGADGASSGATAPQPSFRRDEALSRALFDKLDKNKDGYLTGSELTSPEAQTANWLSMDRDGDGRIARNEFTAIGGAGTGSAAAGAGR